MNGHNSKRSVTLIYPNIPPSKNLLRRKYRTPRMYKELRDGWQRTSWALVQGSDRAWLLAMAALGKRMRIDVTLMHMRLYDTSNSYGSMDPVIDGLVNLGFLKDDDVKHLDLHVMQQKIRADQTVLVIREAEELFPDVLRTKDDR